MAVGPEKRVDQGHSVAPGPGDEKHEELQREAFGHQVLRHLYLNHLMFLYLCEELNHLC